MLFSWSTVYILLSFYQFCWYYFVNYWDIVQGGSWSREIMPVTTQKQTGTLPLKCFRTVSVLLVFAVPSFSPPVFWRWLSFRRGHKQLAWTRTKTSLMVTWPGWAVANTAVLRLFFFVLVVVTVEREVGLLFSPFICGLSAIFFACYWLGWSVVYYVMLLLFFVLLLLLLVVVWGGEVSLLCTPFICGLSAIFFACYWLGWSVVYYVMLLLFFVLLLLLLLLLLVCGERSACCVLLSFVACQQSSSPAMSCFLRALFVYLLTFFRLHLCFIAGLVKEAFRSAVPWKEQGYVLIVLYLGCQ